jgi:hypothetical protein
VNEVHARWAKGTKTLCGDTGYTVLIRVPDDWELVTCRACHYAATHD